MTRRSILAMTRCGTTVDSKQNHHSAPLFGAGFLFFSDIQSLPGTNRHRKTTYSLTRHWFFMYFPNKRHKFIRAIKSKG
jgi:hypothetical protein